MIKKNRLPQPINRLRNDKITAEDVEKLSSEFCDRYCKYPYICKDEDALDEVCDGCPMNKLFEIYDLIKAEAHAPSSASHGSAPSPQGEGLLKPLDEMKVESWQDGIMRTYLGSD